MSDLFHYKIIEEVFGGEDSPSLESPLDVFHKSHFLLLKKEFFFMFVPLDLPPGKPFRSKRCILVKVPL